jgi:hypothetical protein
MKGKLLLAGFLVVSMICSFTIGNAGSDTKSDSKTKKPAKPAGGCSACGIGNHCEWCFDESSNGNSCDGNDCSEDGGWCIVETGCTQDLQGTGIRNTNNLPARIKSVIQEDQRYVLDITEETIRETANSYPRIGALLAMLRGKDVKIGIKLKAHISPIEIYTRDIDHWLNRDTQAAVAYHQTFKSKSDMLMTAITDPRNATILVEVMPTRSGLEISIPENPWTLPVANLVVSASLTAK